MTTQLQPPAAAPGLRPFPLVRPYPLCPPRKEALGLAVMKRASPKPGGPAAPAVHRRSESWKWKTLQQETENAFNWVCVCVDTLTSKYCLNICHIKPQLRKQTKIKYFNSLTGLEPHLRKVSILSGFYCILGNVVPEYHTRVGAVHYPQPLLLHSPHIRLTLQLSRQTFPVSVIIPNSQSYSNGTKSDYQSHFLLFHSALVISPTSTHHHCCTIHCITFFICF